MVSDISTNLRIRDRILLKNIIRRKGTQVWKTFRLKKYYSLWGYIANHEFCLSILLKYFEVFLIVGESQ